MSSAASALLLFFPSKDITVGAAITHTPPYPESDCFNGLLARLVRLLRELHHLHTNSWNSPSPSPDRPRVKRSHGGCYDGKTRFEDPVTTATGTRMTTNTHAPTANRSGTLLVLGPLRPKRTTQNRHSGTAPTPIPRILLHFRLLRRQQVRHYLDDVDDARPSAFKLFFRLLSANSNTR